MTEWRTTHILIYVFYFQGVDSKGAHDDASQLKWKIYDTCIMRKVEKTGTLNIKYQTLTAEQCGLEMAPYLVEMVHF